MKQVPLSRRRSIGSYYTPEWLARAMVSRCIAGSRIESHVAPFRVLDPACGDGAFVLAVLDHLGEVACDRLRLVRECLFGTDADPVAIDSLRDRVAAWIGNESTSGDEVNRVLYTNFVCGDALLGSDWTGTASGLSESDSYKSPIIDWPAAFPQVAAEGGFDLVIGNPPYRRELNAKADFERIAVSPLGVRWRRARMDLWHYFLHRGLDLLKPRGTLCYIVNSYWIGSTAARPVIERLAAETTMDEIVLFGASKLFRDVSGRHMIFRLRKCLSLEDACQIDDLSEVDRSRLEEELASSNFRRTVTQQALWCDGRMRVDPIDPTSTTLGDGPKLGDVFEVRQGIAENPPFVTRTIASELGDPSLVGCGVFVLTETEVESLGLSPIERSLLRPYYALSTVERFLLAPQPSHWLLYLTKQTASTLDDLPCIASHLEPYRAVLERRREVVSGTIGWWHLHWPREERLFTSPRVLCLQMGHVPRFVFADRPTFVGFSQHVIVNRPQHAEDSSLEMSTPSLAALSAILNSSLARSWFEAHAKRRGANLDISGSVLKQFPLPKTHHPEADWELNQLAQKWPSISCENIGDAEVTLNKLVNDCYRNS